MKIAIITLLFVVLATASPRYQDEADAPEADHEPLLGGGLLNLPPQTCGGWNEEFTNCGPNCDPYCDNRPCLLVYVKCPSGCYCKTGYKRNAGSQCIPADQCP